MNQDRVKEILLQIEESELEFSVIFTGKQSKKVNGLYKPDTHEILLHNKNFANDNELLYTAIHEYAHHRIYEIEGGFHSTRIHTPRFWSKFHALLELAEQKELYKVTVENSPELIEITDRIKNVILVEDGRLIKELGALLGKARSLCKKAGVRYEDYVDRVLCLSRVASSTIEKIHVYDINPSLGYESMKMVANLGSAEKREDAQSLFLSQNSPALIRDKLKKAKKEEDPRQALEKEKRRLEKTIVALTSKLAKVEETLSSMPVTPFILCLVLFLTPVVKGFAQATGPFAIPPIPSIPDITIKPSAPPTLPPSPHFSEQKKEKPKNKPSEVKKDLDAKTVSSLFGKLGNDGLLKGLLNTDESKKEGGDEALEKILQEIQKLQKKPTELKETREKESSDGEKTGDETGAGTLLRLRINGREITNDIVFSVCSAPSEDGSFFFSADRQFTANGFVLKETLYILCKKDAETPSSYKIHGELMQNPENENSYLYKFMHVLPFKVKKTGDMLFFRYTDEEKDIEFIFQLKQV